MVDVRVIAAFAIATGTTAACGAADAEPHASSGLNIPAGWQVLPSAAAAARAALGEGVTVDGSEAWGDPAKGCYALWIAFHDGATTADELARDVTAGLATAHVDAKRETSADALVFAIRRAPYRGTLRATLQGARVNVLACVANQREPESCAAACKTLLGQGAKK